MSHQVGVHLLLFGGTTSRVVLFAMIFSHGDTRASSKGDLSPLHSVSRVVYYAFHQLPGLLFLSAYSLLLLHWSRLRGSRSRSAPFASARRRTLLFLFNGLAFAVEAAVCIVYWTAFNTASARAAFNVAAELVAAAFFLALAIAFTLASFKLRRLLLTLPVDVDARNAKTRELVGMSTVSAACFSLRAATLITVSVTPRVDISHLWWVFLAYYGLLECGPCAVVLLAYREPPATNRPGNRTHAAHLLRAATDHLPHPRASSLSSEGFFDAQLSERQLRLDAEIYAPIL